MRFFLSIALLAVAWTAGAQGGAEAILGYYVNNTVGLFFGQTAGWTFQVTTPITVTELGCLAYSFTNNPAAAPIEIGLWAPDGSLLASNSITSGSALFDQSRYESVPPLALSPGQIYHIGAYLPDDYLVLDVAGPTFGGFVTASPGIVLLGVASGSDGFAFPPTEDGTDGGAILGPNFRFQSQPALSIQLWPTNMVRLSWPAVFPGFTLQSELGLVGAWANAGLPVTVVGNEFVALDTLGPGPKYYRLLK